jgi:hypothetical protein
VDDEELLSTYANILSADEYWIMSWVTHYTRADTLLIIKMCLDLGFSPPTDIFSAPMMRTVYDRIVAAEARLTVLEGA